MDAKDTLYAVVKCTTDFAHTVGAKPVGPVVRQFLEDPQGADDELFFKVSGIRFRFYFLKSQDFENIKNNLWADIQAQIRKTDDPKQVTHTEKIVAMMDDWDFQDNFGIISAYLLLETGGLD